MLKQALSVYGGFGCFEIVSEITGDYAVESFWKRVLAAM
jgi:hypothetical protein